jgi:hypothetical protein
MSHLSRTRRALDASIQRPKSRHRELGAPRDLAPRPAWRGRAAKVRRGAAST